MTKNKDPNQKSLAEIAIDPDVLARELALEIEIDPLEQIDEDVFSKDLNITQECDEALKMLKGNREERIQGLRIFCEYSCLLYTSPSPRDATLSRMPSSA